MTVGGAPGRSLSLSLSRGSFYRHALLCTLVRKMCMRVHVHRSPDCILLHTGTPGQSPDGTSRHATDTHTHTRPIRARRLRLAFERHV